MTEGGKRKDRQASIFMGVISTIVIALCLAFALAGCTTHCRGEYCRTTTPIGWLG